MIDIDSDLHLRDLRAYFGTAKPETAEQREERLQARRDAYWATQDARCNETEASA